MEQERDSVHSVQCWPLNRSTLRFDAGAIGVCVWPSGRRSSSSRFSLVPSAHFCSSLESSPRGFGQVTLNDTWRFAPSTSRVSLTPQTPYFPRDSVRSARKSASKNEQNSARPDGCSSCSSGPRSLELTRDRAGVYVARGRSCAQYNAPTDVSPSPRRYELSPRRFALSLKSSSTFGTIRRARSCFRLPSERIWDGASRDRRSAIPASASLLPLAYDILGDDILDPRLGGSWAGSTKTLCMRLVPRVRDTFPIPPPLRPAEPALTFRRVPKWAVPVRAWIDNMRTLRAHYLASVVRIRDWYQDQHCFYIVYENGGGVPLVEGLDLCRSANLLPLARQVESACDGLVKVGLHFRFEMQLVEVDGCYRVEVDPIVGFGGHPGEMFQETRDYVLKLLRGPSEDRVTAAADHRARRVRTDALVHKARINYLIQLPNHSLFDPCNRRLREEWALALWRIYSNVARHMEPNAKTLARALERIPGPWPVKWLKQQLDRGGAVDFDDLRNVLLAACDVEY